MKAERFQQVDEILQDALEREGAERKAFLDETCAGDTVLRGEVEALISCDSEAGSFIETPAFEVAAEIMAGEQSKMMAGQAIGPYQIASRLGSGGMAVVYLAHDSRLGRKVALKLLPDYFTRDEERLRRFQQEARAASALNHPNIVTIYEIGQFAGLPFIATEFIDGMTLRQQMTSTPMKLGQVLDITIQVAAALAASHGAGIVHRDIKPENIMLRQDGYVKVLDFGLAKHTEQPGSTVYDEAAARRVLVKTDPGTVMGTVRYMSPEQVRGLAVDVRTDIWSLGVVFYEMITGRTPFEGATPSDVIASVLTAEPLPLTQYTDEVPQKLERLVTKALQKESKERYQTSTELLDDLKGLKKGLESQQEHSARPEAAAATKTGRAEAIDTDRELWTRTGMSKASRVTRSISYLYRNVADHRQRALIALAILLIASAGMAFGLYKFVGRNTSKANFQEMIIIPGGTFQMGRDDGRREEFPAHPVMVNSFYIDRTKVTNAEYAVFVRETKYSLPIHWSGNTLPAGQENWPVTNVSKDDAEAFAAWRSQRDGVVYRLPTEEEWEYAARNGSLNTLYPWGFYAPSDTRCGQRDEPVNSHPTRDSFRGIYDLVGDVHEWTSSKFSVYPGNNHLISPEVRDWIVYKGGCYRGDRPPGVGVPDKDGITSASRDSLPASRRSPFIGFRLVRSSP